MTSPTFIDHITTAETGGNCPVDFVHLKTGQVLGIDDESVVLYASMDDFTECLTEDRPFIPLIS